MKQTAEELKQKGYYAFAFMLIHLVSMETTFLIHG